jgi:Reverse transcriptase (RNA-dependent DNA polymerase)
MSIRGKDYKLNTQPHAHGWCRRVILDQNVTFPPNSESVVSGRVMIQDTSRSSFNEEWITCANQPSPGLNVAQTVIPNRLTNIPVRILNVNDTPTFMVTGDVIANLSPVELCDAEDNGSNSEVSVDRIAAMSKIIAGTDETVPENERNKLLELLKEFSEVFAFDENEISRTSATQHEIDTAGTRPVRQRMRRQPAAYQEIIKNHVEMLLRQGIIAPAQSPWAANVVLVKKKDNSHRCCIDYCGLNDVSRKDAYALARTDVCLDALAGSVWFSTLDMKSSYHQVEMEPSDADKTAFICREDMYKYLTMPFGLCNAGATFQRLMDIVLSGLTYEICLAYIDDIVIYSRTINEHFDRLRVVLGRLRSAGLKLKPSKCFLFRKSVGFLGHVVSGEGIETDPRKIQAIIQWPRPAIVRDFRAWLGLTGYYPVIYSLTRIRTKTKIMTL